MRLKCDTNNKTGFIITKPWYDFLIFNFFFVFFKGIPLCCWISTHILNQLLKSPNAFTPAHSVVQSNNKENLTSNSLDSTYSSLVLCFSLSLSVLMVVVYFNQLLSTAHTCHGIHGEANIFINEGRIDYKIIAKMNCKRQNWEPHSGSWQALGCWPELRSC